MTDQTTTEAHRLALSEALGLGTGAPWEAIRDRATELAAIEPSVDTVANRAAQAISSMGADVRALTQERNRYRNAWHNARSRAVDARSDADLAEQQAAAQLPDTEARTRLLQALDASYCQALGHTPEGLLAAYEASRIQTVDQAALRETLRRVLAEADGFSYDSLEPHDYQKHVDGVLAAVLPATTNHDTGTVLAKAADRAEIVALRLRLKHDYGAANGANEVMTELRRVADETAATETQRCAHCTHPKGDHDGRADHRAKHSPLVAGDPWCHACNAQCDYAAGARQDRAQ